MRIAHIAPLVALSFLIVGAAATAQPADNPDAEPAGTDFSWIEISMGAGSGNDIRGYNGWTPGPAPFLSAETPFLRGRADVRVGGRFWRAHRAGLPSFTALFASAGWAPVAKLGRRFVFLPGLRAGNYLMSFRTDQVAGQRIESEFAVEPFVRTTIRASERLSFVVEAAARRVFTSPRLDNASVRSGVSWRFDAPDGFRDFLR